MLTVLERIAFVDALGDGTAGFLPLCIDHAGGDQHPPDPARGDMTPFEVPGSLVTGRVVHAAVRQNGQLLIIGEMFFERPESRQIIADIEAGHYWGVSLCTNLTMDADMTTVYSKRVTHIGVTKDPEFGAENTWIHLAATNWPAFYRELATNFIAKEPNMYMSAGLRAMVAPYLSPRIGVQAAASRHSASKPAVRLATQAPAGPVLHFSKHRQTPTTTTKMDQQQQPLQSQLNRDEVLGKVKSFLTSLVEASNGGELPIGVKQLESASAHRSALMSLLQQDGIATHSDKWPSDIVDSLLSLRDYEHESLKKTRDFSQNFYSDAEVRAYTDRALQNPTLPENLPYVAQVMSSRQSMLMNQREMDEKIKQNKSLLTAKETELAGQTAEIESLRRKCAESEKQLQLQLEKTTQESKRPRLDAPAPANSTTTTELKSIDAAASTGSRTNAAGGFSMPTNLPNARIVQPGSNAPWKDYAPQNTPVFADFAAKGYVHPWTNTPVRERIARLAANNAD